MGQFEVRANEVTYNPVLQEFGTISYLLRSTNYRPKEVESLKRRPNIEYTGQTTPELLARKDSHSIVSLLFAFEWGIQAKAKRIGEAALTEEELLVLAVLALDREVNNGGYDQFLRNSSRRFTPIVVQSLQRLGRVAAAILTERAITTLKLKELTVEAVDEVMRREDTERDAFLNICDEEFYKLDPADETFFQFIQDHADRIQLERTNDYPRLPQPETLSNVSILNIHLMLHKRGWSPDFSEARAVAEQLAQEKGIPASNSEIEGAAAFHVLATATRAGDVARGMSVADRAFQEIQDPSSSGLLKGWVALLVKSGDTDLADTSCLLYLTHLKSLNQSTLSTQNNILFWAKLLQSDRDVLVRAVRFFAANFLGIDLDRPLPKPQHLHPRPVPFTERQPL